LPAVRVSSQRLDAHLGSDPRHYEAVLSAEIRALVRELRGGGLFRGGARAGRVRGEQRGTLDAAVRSGLRDSAVRELPQGGLAGTGRRRS
jgi:hypothetical protein